MPLHLILESHYPVCYVMCMDNKEKNNNFISEDGQIDSSRTLEMSQIVLLKKQLRYTQIACLLLLVLIIALIVIAAIVVPDLMETLNQTTELLQKINEENGANIDKLTDAIDKLTSILGILPFGG